MARSSDSSSVVVVLVVLSLLRSCAWAEEHSGDGGGGGDDGVLKDSTDIREKYGLVWTKISLPTLSSDWSNFNDDIESVECSSNINCTAALPGVDRALQYHSNLPTAPYCVLSNNSLSEANVSGHCTCGWGRCVSYSRDSMNNGQPFYYCGPCGFVGSKCNDGCTHNLAECRGPEGSHSRYCECIKKGTFYDMAFCYIPYYGQEIMLNMLIASSIILLCCASLAYGYHRVSRRRRIRRGSTSSDWNEANGRRESPPDDTPPTYEDVLEVEKLPSYQDAMQMSDKNDEKKGISNPALEDDSSDPPEYSKVQNSTDDTVFINNNNNGQVQESTEKTSINNMENNNNNNNNIIINNNNVDIDIVCSKDNSTDDTIAAPLPSATDLATFINGQVLPDSTENTLINNINNNNNNNNNIIINNNNVDVDINVSGKDNGTVSLPSITTAPVHYSTIPANPPHIGVASFPTVNMSQPNGAEHPATRLHANSRECQPIERPLHLNLAEMNTTTSV